MLLWGRSALSCGFAMRKLFVPLPNMKPSTEGGTEHPRVTLNNCWGGFLAQWSPMLRTFDLPCSACRSLLSRSRAFWSFWAHCCFMWRVLRTHQMHIHVYISTFTCVYVCDVYICICSCVYKYMCIHSYVYFYTSMNICTHLCKYVDTFLNRHTWAPQCVYLHV